MKLSLVVLAAVTVFVIAVPVVVHSKPNAGRGMLLRTQAPTVVVIRSVMKITVVQDGQTHSMEETNEVPGVIVDPSGLIMVSRQVSDPMYYVDPADLEGYDAKSVLVSARMILPGEEDEQDVVLVAQDRQLGLAFLALAQPASKKRAAVDFMRAKAPVLGCELYTLGRLPEQLGHAPFIVAINPVGRVERPRAMWLVRGEGERDVSGADAAYWPSGELAGFCVHLRAVPDEPQPETFLIGVAKVRSLVAQALKKVEAARQR